MYFRKVNKIKFLLSYIKYRLSSGTRHDVHSPFVYNLIEKVLRDKTNYLEYFNVEKLRKQLLKDKTALNIEDLGAGSLSGNKKRTVKTVAKNSLKPKKYAQLLFRLVKYFKPKTIIELGTSLGVTSIYFSKAAPSSEIYTIEGSGEIARVAQSNFKANACKNITQITENFDEHLEPLLKEVGSPDIIFFDGNHRKAPTLKYFDTSLRYINNESIFIFDDINWSGEMKEAWDTIKAHPQVKVTIDLFFIGIVFFRKELQKQDFTIRF